MRTNRKKSSLAHAVLVSVVLAVPSSGYGNTPDATAAYMVVNQDLNAFLNQLSQDSGRRINVSNEVRGRISKRNFEGTVDDIMDSLSISQSIDWFEYNQVYFVSAKKEVVTRMVRLGDLPVEDAMAELDDSDLIIDKFPIRTTAEDSALLVTGPPKFLAFLESVIAGIPSQKPVARTKRPEIIIRRGVHISDGSEIDAPEVTE